MRVTLVRSCFVVPLLLLGCAKPQTEIVSVPISPPMTTAKAPAPEDTWWLHVKRQRGCYVVYAEYYVEAKVTRGESWDSETRNVQQLSIGSHGGWSFGKTCSNTYGCSESERKYNLGCELVCAIGTAQDPSGSARVENKMSGCPH